MVPQLTHLTFDFFGTLVEYKPGHFSGDKKYKKSFEFLKQLTYTNTYEQFERDYSEVFNSLSVNSLSTHEEFHMDQVTKIFFENAKLPFSEKIKNELTKIYLAEWNANVVYFPDIKKFINRLKKSYSLSIISNTHYSPLVVDNLKKMNIKREFDQVVTSVDHGRFKPDPLIFADTLRTLKTTPQQTLHIGDSYNDDYIGAKNAGLQCILIDPDKRYEGKIKDRVNSLFEIESLLSFQST